MKDTIKCERCDHPIHKTKILAHNCEYLRRNLLVAKSHGAQAGVRSMRERLQERIVNAPQWMMEKLDEIESRLKALPAELAVYRNSALDAPGRIDIPALIREAAEKLGLEEHHLQWFSWPEVFGSTSGPHGGIGGCVMTSFQVFGFHDGGARGLLCCEGNWRIWRDTRIQRYSR